MMEFVMGMFVAGMFALLYDEVVQTRRRKKADQETHTISPRMMRWTEQRERERLGAEWAPQRSCYGTWSVEDGEQNR